MISRRLVVQGVAIGLACTAGFIAMDQLFPRVAASAPPPPARSAAPRPSTAPPPSAAASASAVAATARAPASAAPSASASAPAAAGMVELLGGPYKPTFLQHSVDVKPYRLDVTEVSRLRYAACVDKGACPEKLWAKKGSPPDPKSIDLPATEVSWADAKAYCAFAQKRLPTEVEWEFAARGPEGRKYPWGADEPAQQLCWRREAGPCPVGTFAGSDTPIGIKDLAGNVWEWTAEEQFCTNPDQASTCTAYRHVARGGAWNTSLPNLLENTFRNAMNDPVSYVGFRCAAD